MDVFEMGKQCKNFSIPINYVSDSPVIADSVA